MIKSRCLNINKEGGEETSTKFPNHILVDSHMVIYARYRRITSYRNFPIR